MTSLAVVLVILVVFYGVILFRKKKASSNSDASGPGTNRPPTDSERFNQQER